MIPHSTTLCNGGDGCMCICPGCRNKEHDGMTDIRHNDAREVARTNRQTAAWGKEPTHTLGELWTQLEALLPPSFEFYLSRQPDNAPARKYACEAYDTHLLHPKEGLIGEGRTPEAACRDLILRYRAQVS